MAEITTWTASPFVRDLETITEGDDDLRAVLEDAELPPLLPALAYATGDLTLLRDHLRPDPLLLGMPQGGLTEEQQAEIRALALEVLVRFRDQGCVPAPVPDEADVQRIMEFAVGGADMAAYLPLLEEELAHRGEDRRAPTWRLDEVAPGVDFEVLVIGAGMSGLLAGHRLRQAGVPFTILEKDDDVGGTWLENQYPGCRVDNPNHNYSYSFAQKHDWPYHFSTQPVLHQYFRDCADAFGLRDAVRFGTEVLGCEWSDTDLRWSVRVRSLETGAEETLTADAVISAVGQLNRPSYPDTIEGFGSFEGPAWHSARWDHGVPLAGKKVVVIGTGASAMQLIPEIAGVAGEQARHAGADDEHLEVDARRDLVEPPRRRPTVLAPVGELLLEQREVGRHVGAADRELHDPLHVGLVRHGRGHTALVPEPHEHLVRQRSDLRLLLLGEPALGRAEEERVGPQVVTQQGEVTGGVGERREQRRQLGVLEDGPQVVVALGDGLQVADERARRPGRDLSHGRTRPPSGPAAT